MEVYVKTEPEWSHYFAFARLAEYKSLSVHGLVSPMRKLALRHCGSESSWVELPCEGQFGYGKQGYKYVYTLTQYFHF